MKIVLQKYVADSGCCSRRQAEKLIREKKVLVNKKLAELGMKVDENDEVMIDNKIIKPSSEKIYIKLNKPVGYTCTNRKFKGEKNVFELITSLLLRAERSNLISRTSKTDCHVAPLLAMTGGLFTVGRLDKNSHGLVLLTNDGDWAERMMHPKFEKEKVYEVKIGPPLLKLRRGEEIINKFKKGIDIGEGDGIVRAKAVEYLGDDKFRIILTQGKKRQIRRMFDVLGYRVLDLLRVRIGNIKLGNLKEGKWENFSV